MNTTSTPTGPTVTRPPNPAGTPRWAIVDTVQIRVG